MDALTTRTEAPVDSIVALTRRLVAVPSRAGVDAYAPVFAVVAAWLAENGLAFQLLHDDAGSPVACLVAVGDPAGPAYLLDATVDTASFGDASSWTVRPTGAVVRDGWLYGRGSADSKVAVALFCHVARFVRDHVRRPRGLLVCAFDADEHTGGFAGIRACLEALRAMGARVEGGAIGYPGNDRVLIGARGFWRARIDVYGVAAHSGGRTVVGTNAVGKAAALVRALERVDVGDGGDFPLPAKFTVTGIEGGGDFSIVPGRCRVDLDVRLTPSFGAGRARAAVEAAVAAIDARLPGRRGAVVEEVGGWPAYRTPETAPFVRALVEAGAQVLGRALPLEIAGPSNTGNFLATRGIAMTCGFGVTARDIHAPDEAFEIASVGPVFETYARAVARLLSGGEEP